MEQQIAKIKRPMPEPTNAPPGSAEKVAVLALRASLRQQLWHPQDARRASLQTKFALLKLRGVDYQAVKASALAAREQKLADIRESADA